MGKLIPIATAFITVYNEERWIANAVQSLLVQTLEDIEILVVDDGSDDRTLERLNIFSDPRLRIISRERSGRANSLAFTCLEARGRYLANLDADDEAYPDRLEKQVSFLDSHPNHAWVGAGEEREDSQRGEHIHRLYPETNSKIRKQSSKCIPYCHSAITFRRELIDQGINYDSEQPYLIDFEFFLRVAKQFKVANLPEILVMRRARHESYFQSHFTRTEQNKRLAKFCLKAVHDFDLPFWYSVYPFFRLVYPYFPNNLKKLIRSKHGMKEING